MSISINQKDYLLSVIIPTFNEQNRIHQTIQVISTYFAQRQIKIELIIIDDGSKDDTLAVLQEECSLLSTSITILQNRENRGKGYSIKRGMLHAKGDLRLFTDADLSTPINEYEKIEGALVEEGYDIAIGSRALAQSKKTIPQNFVRDRMGKLFGWIVRWLLLPDIQDSQCGFKAFTAECAQKIFPELTISRFSFDPELLCIAKKMQYRIKEVPITWENNFDSKFRPVHDTINVGFDLLKLKIKTLWQ